MKDGTQVQFLGHSYYLMQRSAPETKFHLVDVRYFGYNVHHTFGIKENFRDHGFGEFLFLQY